MGNGCSKAVDGWTCNSQMQEKVDNHMKKGKDKEERHLGEANTS